jgi:hypothetical protein
MKINKPSKKQNREPANQRLQMVDQFRQSGLSRKAFCKKRGIPISTLTWWLRKTKSSSKLPAPNKFCEVTVIPPSMRANGTWAMELIASSGLTIRCREAIPVSDLMKLMEETRC